VANTETTTQQSPAAIRRPPNAVLYSHVDTDDIVKLFHQGLSHRKIGKLLQMGPCSVGTRLRNLGLVRQPESVSAAELRECRADPAWEARRRIPDRIVCRECGEWKAVLDAPGEHGHLRKHNMPGDEYRTKWPGARLTNFQIPARMAENLGRAAKQDRQKTLERLMDEFAAMYATPEEREICRKDHEWEEKNDIEDFVVCRLCGFKSKVDLLIHLRKRHDKTTGSYRQEFWKAPMVPLRVKDRKNEEQLPRSAELRKRMKPFLKGGPGRKKKPFEQTADFKCGKMIEEQMPRAKQAMAAIKELSPRDRRTEVIKTRLQDLGFSEQDADIAAFARTARNLACQFTAARLQKSEEAVERAGQRYRNYLRK
jgi:predicted transcriptional regulator